MTDESGRADTANRERVAEALLWAALVALAGIGAQVLFLPDDREPGAIETVGFLLAAIVGLIVYLLNPSNGRERP